MVDVLREGCIDWWSCIEEAIPSPVKCQHLDICFAGGPEWLARTFELLLERRPFTKSVCVTDLLAAQKLSSARWPAGCGGVGRPRMA